MITIRTFRLIMYVGMPEVEGKYIHNAENAQSSLALLMEWRRKIESG